MHCTHNLYMCRRLLSFIRFKFQQNPLSQTLLTSLHQLILILMNISVINI